MKIILIDSGTTNTRIRLINENNHESIDILKIEVGVKNTAMDKNNSVLRESIESGITKILNKNNLNNEDIKHIIASGMITSNLGLREVPHTVAPAELKDFAHGIQKDNLAGITCYFIPGMKNKNIIEKVSENEIKNMDIMRGEEVEVFGLLEQQAETENGLVILPGSHTKYVHVGENKKLLSCFSTLGGELIQAVQNSTILSSSLKDGLIKEIDYDSLEAGYYSAMNEGMTRSLFKIRLLDLFTSYTDNQRANFLIGSILYEDIEGIKFYLKEKQIKWIIVGGAKFLKEGISHLLYKEFNDINVIKATEEQVEKSYIIGSILVQNYKNIRSDSNV